MEHDAFGEVFGSIALLFVAPYIIGPPICMAWILIAWTVRRFTGWDGLLPADVWHAGDKPTPY